MASIAVIRSITFQLQILFANSSSPTILGSQFKLFILDCGFAVFAVLTGLGLGGFGEGTYALYARVSGGLILSKADAESIFGSNVTKRFH